MAQGRGTERRWATRADSVQSLLAKHVQVAGESCPSLKSKRAPHVLTCAAMELLHVDVDRRPSPARNAHGIAAAAVAALGLGAAPVLVADQLSNSGYSGADRRCRH